VLRPDFFQPFLPLFYAMVNAVTLNVTYVIYL